MAQAPWRSPEENEVGVLTHMDFHAQHRAALLKPTTGGNLRVVGLPLTLYQDAAQEEPGAGHQEWAGSGRAAGSAG